MPSATCFLRSVWEDVYWDESLLRSPDYDVFLRISTRTKFLFVPETHIIKRSEPDSLSSLINPVGVIDGAHTLERFYFFLGGDKYISSTKARLKISHRYRKAGKLAYKQHNYYMARKLFKKAISYYFC